MICTLLNTASDMPLSTLIAQWVALAVKVVALVALGYIGKKCFAQLLATMEQERPGVETSWGGLGGSLGGWSVSKSLAWVIVNILVLVVFVALALQVGDGLVNLPAAGTATEEKKGSEPIKSAEQKAAEQKSAEQKAADKQAAPAATQTKSEAGNKAEPPKTDSKTETPPKQDAPKQ